MRQPRQADHGAQGVQAAVSQPATAAVVSPPVPVTLHVVGGRAARLHHGYRVAACAQQAGCLLIKCGTRLGKGEAEGLGPPVLVRAC